MPDWPLSPLAQDCALLRRARPVFGPHGDGRPRAVCGPSDGVEVLLSLHGGEPHGRKHPAFAPCPLGCSPDPAVCTARSLSEDRSHVLPPLLRRKLWEVGPGIPRQFRCLIRFERPLLLWDLRAHCSPDSTVSARLPQGGDLPSVTDVRRPRLYLLQWLKSDKALMMLFNDGTFQVGVPFSRVHARVLKHDWYQVGQ